MVNQKNILIIAISLLFINYVQAKPNYKKSSKNLISPLMIILQEKS